MRYVAALGLILGGNLYGQEISPIHFTGTGVLHRVLTVEGGGTASEEVKIEGDFHTIAYGNALRGEVVEHNPSYGPLIGHDDGQLDGDPPYPPPTPRYPKYSSPYILTNTTWGSGSYMGVEYIAIQEEGHIDSSWEDYGDFVTVTGTLKRSSLSFRRLEIATNEYTHTYQVGDDTHTQSWTYVVSDEYIFEKLTPFGDGPTALLVDFDGDVEILLNPENEEEEWEEAERGILLSSNVMVSTGYRSTARILFADGRVVTLKEMTQIRISMFYDEELTPAVDLILRVGSLNAVVKKAEDRRVISETSFNVRVPSPCFGVRGTQFDVTVSSNGAGVIHVAEGIVDALTTNAAGHSVTQTLYAGHCAVFSSNHIDSVSDTRQTRSIAFDFTPDERARWRFDDDRWALRNDHLEFRGQERGGRPRALLSHEFQGVELDFVCTISGGTNWGIQFGEWPNQTNRFEISIGTGGAWSLERWSNGVPEQIQQGVHAALNSGGTNRLSIDRCEAAFSCQGTKLFRITHTTPIEGLMGFYVEDGQSATLDLTHLNLAIRYIDNDGDGLGDVMEGNLAADVTLPILNLDAIDGDTDLDGDGYSHAQEQDYWTDPENPLSNPATCCGTVQLSRAWTRLYGNSSFNRFYDALLVDSNHLYVTGYSYGPIDGAAGTQADALLTALDGDGEVQWSVLFGDAQSNDYGYGIAQMPDGKLALCGETQGGFDGWTNAGGRDVFVAVFSTNGVRQWSRFIGSPGDDLVRDLACSQQGELTIAGRLEGNLPSHEISGTSDGVAATFASNGVLRWMHFWDSTNSDYTVAAAVDANGDVILGGYVGGEIDEQPLIGGYDLCMQRVTPQGWAQPASLAGTAANDFSFNGAGDLDSNGDYLLGARTHGAIHANVERGDGDAMVTRFPASGEPASAFTWGTAGREEITAVHVMENGLIAVAMISNGDWPDYSCAGDYDAILHVFDPGGHLVAQDFMGTTGFEYPYELMSCGNRLYMVGHSNGDLNGQVNHGGRDGFIVCWTLQIDAPTPPEAPPFQINSFDTDEQGLWIAWPPRMGARHRVEWATNLYSEFQVITSNLECACIWTNFPVTQDRKQYFRVIQY